MDLATLLQLQPSMVSVEVLDPDHYHVLILALRNVLSTEIAEITMAQLVDGLPLADTAWGTSGNVVLEGHPIIIHETLCDGSLEKTKTFRDAFDPAILRFDSRVMQAYQNSEIGSLEFKMRLVELVAVAIHYIAMLLFQLQPKLHDGDIESVLSWKKEAEWETIRGRRRLIIEYPDPKPTMFFHIEYMDYDQYPNGLADVAGYWAEDRIFGGVVLFDRGDSGLECQDVYLHSGRQETTFRVWRLLDAQFNDLIRFLTAETPPQPAPFPIMATDNNLHRYDPWDAIARHHVFRDPWERKFPAVKPEDWGCTRNAGDYPELAAMYTQLFDAYEDRPDPEETTAGFRAWEETMRERPDEPRHMPPEGDVKDQNALAHGDDETNSLYNLIHSPQRSPIPSVSDDRAETNPLYVPLPPSSPVLSMSGDYNGHQSEEENISSNQIPPSAPNSVAPPVAEKPPASSDEEDEDGKKRKISEISTDGKHT